MLCIAGVSIHKYIFLYLIIPFCDCERYQQIYTFYRRPLLIDLPLSNIHSKKGHSYITKFSILNVLCCLLCQDKHLSDNQIFYHVEWFRYLTHLLIVIVISLNTHIYIIQKNSEFFYQYEENNSFFFVMPMHIFPEHFRRYSYYLRCNFLGFFIFKIISFKTGCIN